LQTVATKSQGQEKPGLTDTENSSLQTKPENSPKTPESQFEKLPPDLAEIVAVWPELPEHIRQTIKALIKAWCSE